MYSETNTTSSLVFSPSCVAPHSDDGTHLFYQLIYHLRFLLYSLLSHDHAARIIIGIIKSLIVLG